jgi:hypothetical protein
VRRTLWFFGLILALAITPATAQAPELTVDQIPCQPIVYGTEAHSTAVLACVDEQDGVTLRLHQLGDAVWLEVTPTD